MKNKQQLCYMLLSILLAISVTLPAAESDRLFKVHDASEGLADNGAQVIVCTKTGRMVISSIGHVNFYNGSSFNHIDAQSEDIYELPKYEGHYHLYFDRAHHLWLKDKYQVTCINLMTERFISDISGVLRDMGFNKQAEDLFVDDDGCLLLLSGNQLYNCKFKKNFPVRKGKKLQDVGEYKNLLLLFYDDSSIEAFNTTTGAVVYTKTSLDKVQAAKYQKSTVLYYDHDGFYQIRNGEKDAVLMRVDALSGESKILMETPYHLNNMDIHEGQLYIASQYGYWTYNITTGEKQHYPTLMSTSFQEINTDINDIAFDLQGGMWVGTEKRGLLYSKPHSSPFKILKWSDPKAKEYAEMLAHEAQKNQQETLPRRVNCAYHDSRGWKWYGTYTGVKRYLSEKDENPLTINNEDGLNNNVIHSIIEDNDHNIWVSTSNGISCLIIQNDSLARVVSFNEDDNIPTCTFINGLAMKLEDGSIIMQALDYIVKFNPAHFHTTKRSDIKLYPKLIRLSVNGKTIHPGTKLEGKVILDRAITRATEISVNYNQNNLSLLFTGLNYFRPIQTFYRIRVKGFSNDWEIYSVHDGTGRVDNQGMLHYSIIGIPPGKYQIEVQTSMTPDDWKVEPYVWKLSVNEPWWRMTIVYVTLGLLILGVLIANFVYYNFNTRLKLKRSNMESSILKRIKTFATMCENMETDSLAPMMDAENTQNHDDESVFSDVMMKVVPYVNSHSEDLTMYQLAKVAQMDIKDFYKEMSSDLYKTPRTVVLKLRLQRVEDLLLNSDKSVDEIAEELNFSSTDYMIASFYHQYRQTPNDYRVSNPR